MLRNFLLICYLFGLTRKSHHPRIRYTIPMWSIAGSTVSLSKRDIRRILQRGGMAMFLVNSLIADGRRTKQKSYPHLFRRLFTGPGSDTVAHMICNPIVDFQLFKKTPLQILPEAGGCIFMQIHPRLPIVASVEFWSRSSTYYIILQFLSDDRMQVIKSKTKRFQPEGFAPNLTFHPTLPLLATASGQLPKILELSWFEGRLPTRVTIYQVHLDGSYPKRLAILEGHQSPVTAVAFCPDDSLQVATGDNGGSIRIWNILTRSCVYTINGGYIPPPNNISYCFVSGIIWLTPTKVVTSQTNRKMHYVQITSGGKVEMRPFMANPTEEFNFPCGDLVCMASHPSGNFFVTICGFTLIIFDASSLKIKSTLTLCSLPLTLRFDTLGNFMIIGCLKNLVIARVSHNGDVIQFLDQNKVLNRYIPTVAVHTDGCTPCILSGTTDGSLVLSKI
jgi:WD40 repeat protein